MVSTVISMITCIANRLPTPRDGRISWPIVGWPIADSLPTKWSSVNHRSGKGRQPNADVLTTEPRWKSCHVNSVSGYCHPSCHRLSRPNRSTARCQATARIDRMIRNPRRRARVMRPAWGGDLGKGRHSTARLTIPCGLFMCAVVKSNI